MEEREIVKSKHYNALVLAIVVFAIGFLVTMLWHIITYTHSYQECLEEIEWWEMYSYNGREKFFDMWGSEFAYTVHHMYDLGVGCHVSAVWSFIPFGACLIIALIVYFGMRSYSLTVTDKRIYGKTWFGKRVDLPVDSVTAIATVGLFKGITAATSSGKISFLLIKNSAEVYQELNNLIIERQGKKTEASTVEVIKETQPLSNADELKKYKDLLDAGIITQEEFDAKKKQLLGL